MSPFKGAEGGQSATGCFYGGKSASRGFQVGSGTRHEQARMDNFRQVSDSWGSYPDSHHLCSSKEEVERETERGRER